MEMRVFLLPLSVLLAFIRENEGQITVSHFPNFPRVYVGDDISLTCNGNGEPIKWYINNAHLPIHQDSLMHLTALTPANNGEYKCERNGVPSDVYQLTVLELEPHAQLSLSAGGVVIAKGEGRTLVLHVDDELKGWACFASRFGGSGFKLGMDPDKETQRGFIFAELKEAKRASFWCLNRKTKHRSNAVTLKMTESKVMLEPPATPAMEGQTIALRCVVWGGGKVEHAVFYFNGTELEEKNDDTYTITHAAQKNNGQYSCQATYRYSHIHRQAAQQKGSSDQQELKVIGGPPVPSVSLISSNFLHCHCNLCHANCTTYYWYHTPFDKSNIRSRLKSEFSQNLTITEEGLYSCRVKCENGFSCFSKAYSNNKAGGGKIIIALMVFLIILGVTIIVLVVLKRRQRRRGESGKQAIGGGKDDRKKQAGGDYEQINLTDQGVYDTLGEASAQDKAEAGYEHLKRREDAVYHTLGTGEGQSQGQGEGQGGYEALKGVKAEVYHTLGPGEGQSQGQGQGQGGYEALKGVKAEVYHTLGPGEGQSQGQGQGQGGYEALKGVKAEVYHTLGPGEGQSQGQGKGEGTGKAAGYEVTLDEENPYEELKGEKKQTTKKSQE
ncbi:uncharacterized protein LOC127635055 [Xyrauchen texanus]|uniref:uncharacterized protein LOC127635055 n=1 Tax=Xyrauchen texanus TaxID=154827 RepID=UPI002241DCFF|nr:uncharacterized protein LOC127635055 [Xyrauchen texanus]